MTIYAARMRHARLLLALVLSLAPSVAAAQTIGTPPVGTVQGGDSVVLKDGTVLHGSISEMTPGQAVTIKLQGGVARVVQWSEIQSVNIDRAKAAPAPQPTSSPGTTVLHLEDADDVFVQTLDARGTESRGSTVCSGACDRPLASDGVYRVDGPGLRASKAFRLPEGHVTYRVSRASGLGFAGGLAMVIVGGAAFVNGIGFVILGAEWQGVYSNASDYLVAGGVLMGAGAALLLVGALVMAPNTRTKVLPVDGGAAPAQVPAWRDAPPTVALRPPMIGVPLFAGSF